MVRRRRNPSMARASMMLAAISWEQSLGTTSPSITALMFIIAARSSKSGWEMSTISPPLKPASQPIFKL